MTRPFKFDGQRPFVGQQWKHPSFAPASMKGVDWQTGLVFLPVGEMNH